MGQLLQPVSGRSLGAAALAGVGCQSWFTFASQQQPSFEVVCQQRSRHCLNVPACTCVCDFFLSTLHCLQLLHMRVCPPKNKWLVITHKMEGKWGGLVALCTAHATASVHCCVLSCHTLPFPLQKAEHAHSYIVFCPSFFTLPFLVLLLLLLLTSGMMLLCRLVATRTPAWAGRRESMHSATTCRSAGGGAWVVIVGRGGPQSPKYNSLKLGKKHMVKRTATYKPVGCIRTPQRWWCISC